MKRVLIVEDQPDIRKLIRMTLEFEDYEIHEAADGAFGLSLARATLPDIVLLDVMMPGMSGPQVLQALRQRDTTRGLPVVFMTAKAMSDELEQLLQHGATGLIVKPFDPMTLPLDIRPYWEHGRGPRSA